MSSRRGQNAIGRLGVPLAGLRMLWIVAGSGPMIEAVGIMRAAESERADPRHVALGEQFVGPIKANVVALPSTPDSALLQAHRRTLCGGKLRSSPRRCDMPRSSSHGRRSGNRATCASDRGAKLLLAAQCRLDGKICG